MKDFELLEHTADIKLRVYGNTINDIFKHALIGMFQLLKPQVEGCSYSNDRLVCPSLPQQRNVHVEAIDREALLVHFLSEALYLSDIHNEAYLHVDIKELNETMLEAQLFGVVVQGFDIFEIKAVTYHDLAIKQNNGIWQTDIVFDI